MRKTLILPALLAIAACSSEPTDPLDAARAALAAQNLDTARSVLVAGLRDDPGEAALLDLMADVQLRMGDAVGARATLARLEAVGGKGLRFDQLMAEALLKSNKPQEALALLGEDTSPESVRIRTAALLKLDDSATAVILWQKAVSGGLDASALRMAYDYGTYLALAGDLPGVRRILKQMQAIGANSFETLQLDGKIALIAGDPKAAGNHFARSAKLYPNRIEPVCGQAEALDHAGSIEPALKLLADAEIKMPGQPCVAEIRLSLLSQQGDWGKVRDLLQNREGELDPASPAGMTYAEALLRLGRPEQARAIFSRALLASPQNPYARLMLADAQLETGDAAAALQTIAPLANTVLAGERELQLAERAAKAAKSAAAASYAARLAGGQWRAVQQINAAALAAEARQDWSAAITALQQLDAQGIDSEVQRRLAFALSRAGRHAQAISAADRLLSRQPENSDAIHLAGLVRVEGGIDMEKGRSLLEQAAIRQPGNWQFRQALAKAKAAAG